jgi:hypothetical protein
MAGLVPAIPVGEGVPFLIEMAGTRPAMTRDERAPVRREASRNPCSALLIPCSLKKKSLFRRVGISARKTLKTQGKFGSKIAQKPIFL